MLYSKQTVTRNEFKAAGSMSALVNDELRLDSQYHPNLGGITQGGMANHYPMTILSLQGLGASDEELKAFRRSWPRYRALIEEDLHLVDNQTLTAENWHRYLGQSRLLTEFRRVFYDGLEAAGSRDRYIAATLNRMQDALPMGLFHPLIRLSFACLHGDNRLIADALAYWAIRYEDLYQVKSGLLQISQHGGTKAGNASACWQQISQNAPEIMSWGGSLHICEQLCSHADIQALSFTGGFAITAENLNRRIQEISESAVRLYLFEPALTTLHAVTACQALVDITRRCIDSSDPSIFVGLWQRYWVWLTCLYLEKGHPEYLPEIDPAREAGIMQTDWQELANEARKTPEVHLVKMVYSCKWLFENIEANPYYTVAVINILKARSTQPVTTYGLKK